MLNGCYVTPPTRGGGGGGRNRRRRRRKASRMHARLWAREGGREGERVRRRRDDLPGILVCLLGGARPSVSPSASDSPLASWMRLTKVPSTQSRVCDYVKIEVGKVSERVRVNSPCLPPLELVSLLIFRVAASGIAGLVTGSDYRCIVLAWGTVSDGKWDTGVEEFIGSKVQCLFYFQTTCKEGRGEEMGGSAKFQTKAHRTFDPRITLTPV